MTDTLLGFQEDVRALARGYDLMDLRGREFRRLLALAYAEGLHPDCSKRFVEERPKRTARQFKTLNGDLEINPFFRFLRVGIVRVAHVDGGVRAPRCSRRVRPVSGKG